MSIAGEVRRDARHLYPAHLFIRTVLLEHGANQVLFRKVHRGKQVVNDVVVEAAGQQKLAPQRQVDIVVIGGEDDMPRNGKKHGGQVCLLE